MLSQFLTNPQVVSALVTALIFVVGWAGRKLIKLIDAAWAARFLTMVGNHAELAVIAARREYIRVMELAAAVNAHNIRVPN